jgi:hypothetical protein
MCTQRGLLSNARGTLVIRRLPVIFVTFCTSFPSAAISGCLGTWALPTCGSANVTKAALAVKATERETWPLTALPALSHLDLGNGSITSSGPAVLNSAPNSLAGLALIEWCRDATNNVPVPRASLAP